MHLLYAINSVENIRHSLENSVEGSFLHALHLKVPSVPSSAPVLIVRADISSCRLLGEMNMFLIVELSTIIMSLRSHSIEDRFKSGPKAATAFSSQSSRTGAYSGNHTTACASIET